MESACREKHACLGRAPGVFRRPDRHRRTLKHRLLADYFESQIFLGLEFCVKNLRRNVPITASGPQGEQPLLDMNNAGKGSRQIGPVTLGKGLALVLRGSGCFVVGVLFR